MASLEIKLNLSDEDRARLDKLTEALSEASGAAKTNIVCHQHGDNSQHIDNVGTVNIGETIAVPEPPKAAAVPETPKQEPKVTAADVQAKVVQLIGRGLKNEVKDIVKKYAARVSEIPEDKRAVVMAELKALGG